MESVILNSFIIRAGFIYPQYYDYGDITFCIGYKLKGKTFTGTLNYSVIHFRDYSFLHYIGIDFEYGKLDREPPLTKISPDKTG